MWDEEELVRFEVAIWERWHQWQSLPVFGTVSAVDAEVAIAAVMRAFHLERAEHVAAHDLAHVRTYRADNVVLGPERPLVTPKDGGGVVSR